MTKRIDRLRRRYPNLTVLERVQLLLAAQERGDLCEIDALDRSCPFADVLPYLTRLIAASESDEEAARLSQQVTGAIGEALWDMATRDGIDLRKVVRFILVGNIARP